MNYTDERIEFSASVRRATLRDGLRRLVQREEAAKQEYPDAAEWFFHSCSYVDVTAASPTGTLVVDGQAQPWPPTYEQFVDLLPETAVNEWLEETYRLNPDWRPVLQTEDETQEKKDEPSPATGPSIESSTS